MSSYTIPHVIERRPTGERVTDIYSRLLSDRIIYLGCPLDDGVANVIVAQLLYLDSDSPENPIQLYINCSGGDISAMLGLYDTMQYISSPVSTICVGRVTTPAAVLLAGGAPGERSMLQHTVAHLHQPSAAQQGTIPDLVVAADEVARVRSELENLLAKHTGRDVATVRADTDRDLVLTAGQAVEYGLVDNVVTTLKGAANLAT